MYQVPKPRWGVVIKGMREDLQISQGYLAEKSGISQGYISQLETGENYSPTLTVIARLAFAFGVPLHYFLRRGGYDCGCAQYEGNLNITEEPNVMPPS